MTKKLITFIITATLVAVFGVQQITSAAPSATFDPITMTLDVSGNIGDTAGISYIVTIAARGNDTSDFSTSNPPLGISMFKTGYTGEISEVIPLPTNFEGGEYTAFFAYNINSEDIIEASHFSYTNANESATVELLKLLNGEDSGDKKGAKNASDFYNILSPRNNITKFGITYDNVFDESKGLNKIPFMCDVTYSMKKLQPDSKFTFESLCTELFSSIAAYDIKENGLESADANSSYLGELYPELDNLSDDETKKLDSLLRSADYKGKSLSDIFTENYIMAKLLCANTRLKMKDVILTYHSELDIDISSNSRYSKVKDGRLHIIFEGIMKEISDNSQISDIKEYFDKYVTKALDDPDDSGKTSSGGSSGKSSGKSSGSVISGTNLTNPNTTTTQSPVITPEANNDIEFYDLNNHFALESVQKLSEAGIINGYTDGSFKPDGNVTRAEFCKIIALAFNIKTNGTSDFTDVDENAWYADYVYALAQNGIITGYNGNFMPNSNITREDAAVILHRVFALKNIDIPNAEKQFDDLIDASDYAKSPIALLASASVINGDGLRFYPKNPITRGETAVLVCNALNYTEGGSVN